MKKFWKIFLGLFIFLTLGVIVQKVFFAPNNNKKALSSTVKRGDLEKKLIISGKIEAEEYVTLQFQTAGRLSWVGVKEGDYVKKYQAIASLDKREVEKNLIKALRDYAKERNDFEEDKRDTYRYVALTDTIKRILEKNQWDLEKAVLDVEIKQIALEYANLWTPIEGIVTQVTAPFAGIDTTLYNPAKFEIVNPKSIYFSATADQSEVKDLYEGLYGDLTLDSYPDEVISGYIKSVSFTPKEDETGTVYEIKFVFNNDNSSYKYKMGMTGDLEMVVAKKEDVLYVPLSFVKEEDDKKYLKIKKDGKIEKAYVTTGMETDEDIEIVSGISENETVYD